MRKVDGANFVRPATGIGVRMYGSSSGYAGWKPKAAAGSIDLEMPSSLAGSNGQVASFNTDGTFAGWISAAGVSDHGGLTGLSDDDHSIYALLAGRSTNQTQVGATSAGGTLTLQSTAHATKGKILFGTSAYDEVNNRLGVGTASPGSKGHFVNGVGGGSSPNGTFDALTVENNNTAYFNFISPTNKLGGFLFSDNVRGQAIIGYTHGDTSYGSEITDSIVFFVNGSAVPNVVIDSSGNLGVGVTSFGTSAMKVLSLATGVAPSSSTADSFQHYSADISAGVAAPHFRTENGKIVRIYQVLGWALPTATLTRTTFDPATVTLPQLAERVAALITDLFSGHHLLGT